MTHRVKLVGIIDLRHRLTPFLMHFGGNIGYSVLPEERGKGCAKEMLGLSRSGWIRRYWIALT